MAEILLRIVDKATTSNATLDRQTSKAWDVVTVQADGWPWSATELANPEWRVIQLPGVSDALLLDLLEPERSLDGLTLIRKRKKYVNIPALPTKIKNKIISGPSPVRFNTTDSTNIQQAKVVKEALAVVVG